MAAQRASLDQKLDRLENRIVQTVDGAREAVAETVQTVKDTVQSSVESVRGAVHSSVEAVKDTLDVPAQVQRNPWAMFGGSVALGFAAGCVLNHAKRPSRELGSGAFYGREAGYASRPATGSWPSERQPSDWAAERRPISEAGTAASGESLRPSTQGHASWLNELSRTFAPELQKLKGMAIGAVMGVVRDLANQAVAEPLRPQVSELLNNVTTKLGGEPMEGHMLDEELLARRRGDGHPNGHRATWQDSEV
jgi:hypothetical protein